MKKLTNLIAAGAIALSFSMPTVQADPGKGAANDLVEICKFFVENGFFGFDRVGECVGEGRRDAEIQFCNFLKEEGFLELFGYKSHGQCVKAVRQS